MQCRGTGLILVQSAVWLTTIPLKRSVGVRSYGLTVKKTDFPSACASPQPPAALSHRSDPAISYPGLRRGGYPGTGSSVEGRLRVAGSGMLARCARGKSPTSIWLQHLWSHNQSTKGSGLNSALFHTRGLAAAARVFSGSAGPLCSRVCSREVGKPR